MVVRWANGLLGVHKIVGSAFWTSGIGRLRYLYAENSVHTKGEWLVAVGGQTKRALSRSGQMARSTGRVLLWLAVL